ncbi:nucleotidyl transferase AbiEii/AbiGii toxin family protein [Bifidobacterium asteroides]|uniref:Nucleotidyl transferase AbiEii/AbiGii toxin family protein n=1 Tax=Bifidobacterium asteroides TaxID=1684 RepID=A0A6N7TVA9_9BIFI|nr:nucleotidyl transferase AbiEii/AbiGii toxin family protein [Bifidobacterium asteroides]MSD91681.1 hypothetical protein [Bifidobacterium asteroides]
MTNSTTTDPENIQRIIEMALRALFSIDELAGKIALHGGQAMIAHNISHRSSQDIDLFIQENSVTDQQVDLIKEALNEEFRDSNLEVRRFRSLNLPIDGTPKVQKKITATIAEKSQPNKAVPRFNGHRGLDIEISLNNNMLYVTQVNNKSRTPITVATLIRIVYEKVISLCQNSPSYRATHPKRGNSNGLLRAKDIFDLSSILTVRPELRNKLAIAVNINYLKTLMKETGVEKSDLANLLQDMAKQENRYRAEYDTVNTTLVPVNERISFQDANNKVQVLLKTLLGKL